MIALDLRDYQDAAFEQTRQHLRDGARSVLISAPTGSGKTVLAAALMDMAVSKGRRANFVVDRLSLIEQTSETFDRYGLAHGVIQSQHPRYRPSLPIQICSVQTLAKRGWPESNVDVFDEAHVLHATHKARIAQRATVCVGLTATPFTRGLGKYFDAVVNVTTTRKLINEGWLARYRAFSCAEPDMSGVTIKSTGEWDDTEASDKALEVVGDVVAEYLRHGEGRKFICSGVDTAHVEELVRQFLAAGINVAGYTYKDSEEDRAVVTAEFRKPTSLIRGLVTVTAASRGFDVPDVSCVIMARPLRKSLAEHIQLFGRGLRIAEGKADCLARGTLVLTDCGEVPIEHVTLDHKVWDGENYVSHAGAVCRGMRGVIEYDGLIATPDHRVMTDDGWTRFEEAASRQRRIARTGVDGRAIRLADDHEQGGAGRIRQTASVGSLRSVLRRALGAVPQLAQALGQRCRVPSLQCTPSGVGSEMAVSAVPIADGSLLQPEFRVVRALRSAWDRIQVCVGQRGGALGRGKPWGAGPCVATGPHPQHGPLRAWQSPLDDARRKHEQHTRIWWPRKVHSVSQSLPRHSVCGLDTGGTLGNSHPGRDCRALERALVQTEREVWDVLNAGPLQRFTANGRLVHNCRVLDHAGNMARFWQDCEAFFDDGVSGLDDGKPKPKKVVMKAEAEPVKCPSCRAIHKQAPHCPVCGHEYPKRQCVQHVPGTLKELLATEDSGLLRKQLWPQVCWHVRHCKNPRDDDHAQRMAQAIYAEMAGRPAMARYETTTPVVASSEVSARIRANQQRWAIAKRAAEAKQEARA